MTTLMSRRNGKILQALVLVMTGVVLFFNPLREAPAADTGISGTNLEFYHPTIDPFGTFAVNAPRMMGAGQFHLKLSQDIAGNALFRLVINGRTVDIVSRFATTDFVASLGVNRFLTVGFDLPVHFYAREANLNSLEAFNTQSLGDLRMAFKFRVLQEDEKGKRPGLALLLTNSLSTGEERKFLGTSHAVPGVTLIGGKEFPLFGLILNAGMQFPEKQDVLGIEYSRVATYAGAIRVPFGFWDRHLSVIGEVNGHLQAANVRVLTSPLEYTVGLRKDFRNGLTLTGGGGGGWNNAIGNPRFRGIVTLGFTGPTKSEKIKPPQKEKEEEKKEAEGKRERREGRQEEGPFRTTVYFPLGAVQPTKESYRWIQELAARAKGPSGDKDFLILVEGHTDSEGTASWNQRLSERRATAVKGILVKEGIRADRIETRGRGEEAPAAPNETPEGCRQNRRVEIY